MKRTLLILVGLGLAAGGCGGSKKDAKDPADKSGSETTTEADAGASGEAAEPSKASLCTGGDIDLMAALIQSACETKGKPDDKPRDMKGLLEVKLNTSANKIEPGGHVDLIVSFVNKSKDPLPLDFVLDPTPRFTVEAYTAKGKRADMPAGNAPARPAGSEGEPATPGLARVTITPNGSAHVKIGWDATKTKWAPEKVKGTPPEMGYPRSPAGPLGKGKYELRVVTPLANVMEGSDHEVSAPKTPLEIGK